MAMLLRTKIETLSDIGRLQQATISYREAHFYLVYLIYQTLSLNSVMKKQGMEVSRIIYYNLDKEIRL